VTGVFQTLSCGKAGQRVPGKTGPEEATGGGDEVVGVVAIEVVVEERTPVVEVERGTDVVVDAADVDLVAISGGLLRAEVDLDTCVPDPPEVEVVACFVATARGDAFGVAHPAATVRKASIAIKGPTLVTRPARFISFHDRLRTGGRPATDHQLPGASGRLMNLLPQVDTARWHAQSGAIKTERIDHGESNCAARKSVSSHLAGDKPPRPFS
jgi:hypothetical protein